jgi:hypothetical protein
MPGSTTAIVLLRKLGYNPSFRIKIEELESAMSAVTDLRAYVQVVERGVSLPPPRVSESPPPASPSSSRA